ncbi:MAG: T7SS effector LXG polymorphic toxin [Sporolactobacillus sp.]
MKVVMGSSGTAANTIRYDAKVLIQAAEARAKQYQTLGEEMRQLKQSFAQITELGSSFKGRGAEKIKAFYQAQETVVDAWLRLIEKQVAFLNGIAGEIDDRNLGGATRVQIPFLESDLSIAYWRSRDVARDQKESINKVLQSISDLIPVGKLNTEDVERQLDKANRAQAKMSEDVRDLDRTLLNEYQQVISDVPQIVSLYSALENATRQGSDVEPLHFNAEAFYYSEAYKIQGDLEKQTAAYLTFKKQQEQARKVSKKEEEAVNRPWYEKAGAELRKAGHVYNEVEDGIDDGVFDTVKDTVVGLWDMVTSPHETAEAIVHAGRHPVKTAELLASALSNSFEKNMVHGNAYTRTHWITYTIATIALSLLGTKGIDKVGKMVDVGKLAEKAGVVTKNTASAVAATTNSFQSPFTPKYRFAGGDMPYNTINSKGLRAMLSKINGENEITGDLSKKGNIGSKGLNDNIEDVKKGSSDSVQKTQQMEKFEDIKEVVEKSMSVGKSGEGTNNFKFVENAKNHLKNVENVNTKKGIVGGHNTDEFNKALKNQGFNPDDLIVSKQPHPSIEGVYEVEYKIPRRDMSGNIAEPISYKAIKERKTIYDPSKISDDKIYKWGQEAMQNGTINGRLVEGAASNGLKFRGYLNDAGEITNFFPIID